MDTDNSVDFVWGRGWVEVGECMGGINGEGEKQAKINK